MKKMFFVLCTLLFFSGIQFAQESVVFFDGIETPWFEWNDFWSSGSNAYVINGDTCKMKDIGAGYQTGKNAIKWVQDEVECGVAWAWWSDWNKFDYRDLFDGGSLHLWLKTAENADTIIVEFKSDDQHRMHYYLTQETGNFNGSWNELVIPFKDFVTPQGMDVIDSTHVTLFGIYSEHGVKGNRVYVGYISADPPPPYVFFNGQLVPSDIIADWGFWGSTYGAGCEISANEGYRSGTSAMKWVQDAGWGSCGIYWVFNGLQDLTDELKNDTLKFKLRTPAPVDSIKIEINSDKDHAVDYSFKPGPQDTWQIIEIPLSEFKKASGKDFPDSTKINEFGIFTVLPTDGLIVYLTDIWFGSPTIEVDTTPPAAPANIVAVYNVGKFYYDSITWDPVPGEENETYDVYASTEPITDVNASNVIMLAENVTEDDIANGVNHYLAAPRENQTLVYYYAVVCTDKSNNTGAIGSIGPVSSVAQYIPPISFGSPLNFMADGFLNEWTDNNIDPVVVKKSTTIVNGMFNDDADLTANIYMAADANYLYIAVDAVDDFPVFDATGIWNKQDFISIYIGLFNQTGKKHTGGNTTTLRGSEPDYAIYLLGDKVMKRAIGNWNFADMYLNGSDNYNVLRTASQHFTMEAMISLEDVRFEGDARFTPTDGMKIPINITIDDRDESSEVDGYLATSPYENGWSWGLPEVWTETWIKDLANDIEEDQVIPLTYSLGQNYPNPFNPATTIHYTLAKSGIVTLKVYDVLGREVAQLVSEYKNAGSYTVTFDISSAKNLSSGVYFYSISAGEYQQVKKMMLIK